MADLKQCVGVSPRKVYSEDFNTNLGRLSLYTGVTYKFVKVASGSYISQGDALSISSSNVATQLAATPVHGIAVCDVDAMLADQYALVIIDAESEVRVNVGGASSTVTAASAMANLPMVYNALGNVKDGTMTTSTSTAASGSVDITAFDLNAAINTMITETELLNGSPLISAPAGSASISGASAYRKLNDDYTWRIGHANVSTTATTDISASAQTIQVGDILTVSGSASYEDRPITATATGISGIIISVLSGFGEQITAGTYSGDVNVYVSKLQVPVIFT